MLNSESSGSFPVNLLESPRNQTPTWANSLDRTYRFMDVDDPDLKLILDAFNVHIPAMLFRLAELKSIKTGITVFM